MRPRPPKSTRTYSRFPYTTLFRSAFAMTEPDVASSDATNIACSIRRDGDAYVIDGRKRWTSNAGKPRCRIMIVMGKRSEEHTSELQSLMRISYAVCCLKKKKNR